MSAHVVGLWSVLGERQHEFVFDLIEPLQTIALVPSKVVRYSAVPIFFDMMMVKPYLHLKLVV